MAELTGDAGVSSDVIVHSQEIPKVARDRYAVDLNAKTRSVLEGYAEGVNRYARENPSGIAPGLLPVAGQDLAAYMAHLGLFFSGVDAAMASKLTAPAKGAEGASKAAVGSNGLAVAPRRSADGATRLLVNSHQPFTGPLAWYEAVVESEEGWHVAGGFFPGVPFLLHGHNETLGWASTVNKPDVVDAFKLTTDQSRPNQYMLDGRWRQLTAASVSLKVKRGSEMHTVSRELLRSVHGPVINSPDGSFAFRYPGMQDLRQAEFIYRLNKARNLPQWRAAFAMGAWPSINYTYADAAGNIGYLYNARFPVRREGLDWAGVLPGDRSDLIWKRQLSLAQLPQVWNPASGYVFNSNNTPFQASAASDNPKLADYSKTLGIETLMTNRAFRVLETYGVDASITAEEFDRYKYDLEYSPRSTLAMQLQALLALPAPSGSDVAAAQSLLRNWDRRTDLDNRGAALAIMTIRQLSVDKSAPPLTALKAAADHLKTHFGRIDPPWGEVNRLRRGTTDLAVDGGPDIYRSIFGTLDADGRSRAAIGDSYVMFVEWDRLGRLSSRSVHQFGSATLDPNSPHYADQSALFVKRKTKPVLFTEQQLKGHVRRSYRVTSEAAR